MIQVEVHPSALKRGLEIDEVIRMWAAGTHETLVADDEPSRYLRLAFDAEGRPWELAALSFGRGTRYLVIHAMPARRSTLERMLRRKR